VLGNQLN